MRRQKVSEQQYIYILSVLQGCTEGMLLAYSILAYDCVNFDTPQNAVVRFSMVYTKIMSRLKTS